MRARLLIGTGVLVLVGVLVVGLLPTRVDGGVEHEVRAFVDRMRDAGLGWVSYDLIDFLANIAFFVPVGLIAGLLFGRRWWLAIPIGIALSVALEVGQALFLPERYASATDVLANTAGTVLGALLAAAILAAGMRAATRRQAGSTPPARPTAPR